MNRLEQLCRALDKAIQTVDRVQQYRLTLVMLAEIIQQHKALKERVIQIERKCSSLNTLPTTLHCDAYRHHSSRGWGNSGRSWTTGESGNQLHRIKPIDAKGYADSVYAIAAEQRDVSEQLTLLTQYAEQWSEYRSKLVHCKPRNIAQRRIQNVLLMTYVGSFWLRQRIEDNPVLGVICGRFAKTANVNTLIHHLCKKLDDVKGNIGRESQSEGDRLISRYNHPVTANPDKHYLEWYGRKEQRAERVKPFVSQSNLYQSRLSWIHRLDSIEIVLSILPMVDSWKEQYAGTNRLAYMTAANRSPYVRTIVTTQLEQVGTILHLETSVPVYAAECLQYTTSKKADSRVYFLGKTGSTVVDDSVNSVDWYHIQIVRDNEDSNRIARAIDYLSQRLGYARNVKLSLLERRKEIASYARKLIWLETMNMLDSKSAGNCLPGTIQFAQELGLPCPSNWKDHCVDTRTVLRKWKEKGYNANRLLLPAIDSAVNRVKATLCQLTVSGYVPSVVR